MPIVPRTGHVSEGDRKKIRDGKFVDFASLCQPTKDTRQPKRFTVNLESGMFEQAEEQGRLTSARWMDAFLVFMSIRVDFAPGETQGLLRHCQIVKNLWTRGKDGNRYDDQFRRLKEQHADIQWGEYMAELIDELPPIMRHPPVTRPPSMTRTNAYRGGPSQVPGTYRRPFQLTAAAETCFSFNSPGGCSKTQQMCRFRHRCRKCLAVGHAINKCPK